MKIKTKLNLGVGLLFVMIIILSLISAYSVFLIKVDTQNILKANYNTLEYSRNMLLSLENKVIDERVSIAVFEENLNKHNFSFSRFLNFLVLQLFFDFSLADHYKKTKSEKLLQ